MAVLKGMHQSKNSPPRDVKLKLNPWMNSDILKLIRIRDRLFARKKREPDNELVKVTDFDYKIGTLRN